jgi:hypothetical protein
MRWLFCLAVLALTLGGSLAFGQRSTPLPSTPVPRVSVPPLSMPPPTMAPPPQVAPVPMVRPVPVAPAPSVLPGAPAAAPALVCTDVCTSRARECGALEQAFQDATWQQVQDLLNHWDDNPENSPDPPCVRGYNQCRLQC